VSFDSSPFDEEVERGTQREHGQDGSDDRAQQAHRHQLHDHRPNDLLWGGPTQSQAGQGTAPCAERQVGRRSQDRKADESREHHVGDCQDAQ